MICNVKATVPPDGKAPRSQPMPPAPSLVQAPWLEVTAENETFGGTRSLRMTLVAALGPALETVSV